MLSLSHIEAIYRGWYPHWLAQVRGWSTEAIVLWSAVLFVMLRSLRMLQGK